MPRCFSVFAWIWVGAFHSMFWKNEKSGCCLPFCWFYVNASLQQNCSGTLPTARQPCLSKATLAKSKECDHYHRTRFLLTFYDIALPAFEFVLAVGRSHEVNEQLRWWVLFKWDRTFFQNLRLDQRRLVWYWMSYTVWWEHSTYRKQYSRSIR